jgi:hypothetical protein
MKYRYIYILCTILIKFNDFHNLFQNCIRSSIVNAKKLYCIVVEVSTCHFRAVPAQARPKMRVGPCSPPSRDSGHGTALVFVSCRYGPKYFVSCRVSGRTKRPCHDPPSNSTAQVLALRPTTSGIIPCVRVKRVGLDLDLPSIKYIPI